MSSLEVEFSESESHRLHVLRDPVHVELEPRASFDLSLANQPGAYAITSESLNSLGRMKRSSLLQSQSDSTGVVLSMENVNENNLEREESKEEIIDTQNITLSLDLEISPSNSSQKNHIPLRTFSSLVDVGDFHLVSPYDSSSGNGRSRRTFFGKN